MCLLPVRASNAQVQTWLYMSRLTQCLSQAMTPPVSSCQQFPLLSYQGTLEQGFGVIAI